MADTVILPMAQDLLSCLAQELNLNPDVPQQFCLRAGDQVIHDFDGETSQDKTCCPGLAYVRIGSVYPSSNFPSPDTDAARGCFPVAWAVELVMGVIRCVPGMGSVAGPDCTDWQTATIHDLNDSDAMRRALCCWTGRIPRQRLWLAQAQTVSIQADCIERQQPLLVSIPKCC